MKTEKEFEDYINNLSIEELNLLLVNAKKKKKEIKKKIN